MALKLRLRSRGTEESSWSVALLGADWLRACPKGATPCGRQRSPRLRGPKASRSQAMEALGRHAKQLTWWLGSWISNALGLSYGPFLISLSGERSDFFGS